MKTFKFLMPFMLAVLVIAGCNTDDLRNDIDELKNRVESLEAQVASINENMNVLRVLIDGNKTITSCVYDEEADKYTLTLSDGSVLTLTQGKTGTVNYPTISVDAQGFWTINGESTGTKAEAENGKTPEFRIEEGTNYWQVRFSEEEAWEYVYANGEEVAATSDDVKTDDKFFQEVYADADYFYITLKGALEPLKLPIVQDLKCAISTDGIIGFGSDGVLSVGLSGTREIPMTIKGDNCIVTAPLGWTATVEKQDGEEAAMLKITAPSTPTSLLTRAATADNTLDIVVQVNKGIYWAVSKLQVKAVDAIEDLSAQYAAGGIKLLSGTDETEITIDKTTYGEALVINSDNAPDGVYTLSSLPTQKVIFVEPGYKLVYSYASSFKDLIIIGNNELQKSDVEFTTQVLLNNRGTNGIFALYNTNTVLSTANNAIVNNVDGNYENIIFENTNIEMDLTGGDRNLIYIGSQKRGIKNLIFKDCKYKLADDYIKNHFIISIGSAASSVTYSKIALYNSVFYQKEQKAPKFRLFHSNFIKDTSTQYGTLSNLIIDGCTFVNLFAGTESLLYMNVINSVNVEKNLFFNNNALTNNNIIIRCNTTYPSGSVFSDNLGYPVTISGNNTYQWKATYGTNLFSGGKEITTINTNPFEGGEYKPELGIFKPNSTYSQYGANLE